MSLLAVLHANPKNPRKISDESFKRLKQSIRDFPQMLELRPIVYDTTNTTPLATLTVLGGNMRLKAVKELEEEGFEVKDSYFKSADNLTEEEKRIFVIKDNLQEGEWDYELLRDEWSDLPLSDWGFDVEAWEGEAQDEIDRLDQTQVHTCPKCGFEFNE